MVTWQEFMVAIDTVGREILQKCWGARYCHTIRVWYIYTCAFGIEMIVNVGKYDPMGMEWLLRGAEELSMLSPLKRNSARFSTYFLSLNPKIL